MFVIVLISTIRVHAQSVESELQDFFYPFAKFSYLMSPTSENPNLVATYSLSNGNILTKTIEMWNGYSTKKMSEEAYKLSIDEEKQAIVSRLATYGYWGDPGKVSCIDKSVNISLDDPITEISKSEYEKNR